MTVNELMECISARERYLWKKVKWVQRTCKGDERYYSNAINEWAGVYQLYLDLKAELEKGVINNDGNGIS